jgi:hypothetical protein
MQTIARDRASATLLVVPLAYIDIRIRIPTYEPVSLACLEEHEVTA